MIKKLRWAWNSKGTACRAMYDLGDKRTFSAVIDQYSKYWRLTVKVYSGKRAIRHHESVSNNPGFLEREAEAWLETLV